MSRKMKRAAIAATIFGCACRGAADEKPAEAQSLQESTAPGVAILQLKPDETVRLDPASMRWLELTDLPWRILLLPSRVEMALVPPGRTRVPFSEWNGANRPFHLPAWRDVEVDVPSAIYCARYEASQGSNAGVDPVMDGLSFDEASAAARALGCRLPTDSEWLHIYFAGGEATFKARALRPEVADEWVGPKGSRSKRAKYPDGPRPGGMGSADALGLFDVYGNVAEWCVADIPSAKLGGSGTPFHSPSGLLNGEAWHGHGSFFAWRYGPLFLKSLPTEASLGGFRPVIDASVVQSLLK